MLWNFAFSLLLCSAIPIKIVSTSSDLKSTENEEKAAFIDAQVRSNISSCLVELRKVLPTTQSLDNFVGTGWDDLRNVQTGYVLLHTFSQCETTPEGQFLLPDNVMAIPVQQTQFDQMATFHDSFKSYFQSITDTINVDVSASYYGFSASGSFSQKHQTTKLEMATTNSKLFITKLKAHSYSLIANPDAGLHPFFKNRLLRIAHLLRNSLILQAMYEAQLLIRDYGTHYVSRVELGAITEQHYFVENDIDFTDRTFLSDMKASVSVSFQGFFGGSVSVGRVVTEEAKQKLSSMTRHVRVNTQGGPSAQRLAACKPSANSSCEITVDNLVALDHEGEPLFALIAPHMLKELHSTEVILLYELVKNATIEYYKRNEIPGCMTFGDKNFAFQANVDDGTCNETLPLRPYGGVFQQCSVINNKFYSTPEYRCDQFIQRNTITGDFTCPAGFVAVPVMDFVYEGFEDRNISKIIKYCYREFLWLRCPKTTQQIVLKDRVHLKSFSCEPDEKSNTDDPSYLFGGLYSKGHNNIFTNGERCPSYYFPAKIAGEVFVCLSRDTEMARLFAVPLGGFFSCQTIDQGKKCPPGYSQHLATITPSQCEVYYCIQAGIIKHYELALIKRPPYLSPSVMLSNVSVDYVRYFENETLLIAYPLEVVIEDVYTDSVERKNFLRTATSNDINEVVTKWIHKKLLEMGPEKSGHTWINGLLIGVIGGILATALIVAAISLTVYYRRRPRRPVHEPLTESVDDNSGI